MKKSIRIIASVLALALMCVLAGCGGSDKETSTQSSKTAAPTSSANLVELGELDPALIENTIPFTITLTDGRTISGVVYPDLAPITVENFVNLCNEGFYDGLIFHRVIEDFMIQGGGYDETGAERAAESITGEFAINGIENNLPHTRGVISMARAADYDSASSQFFIVQQDYDYGNGKYAAFGMVTEGMEVVDEIAAVETDSSDCPLEPIVIQSITIDAQ